MRAPAGAAEAAGALQASYPADWLSRYAARGYRHVDPAVTTARRARLPFRWGHGDFLSRFEKTGRRVFHEAKDFGVTEGWAVPVHGPEGDAGVFSICAPRASEIEEAVAAAAGEIQLFAAEFHDAVLRASGPRQGAADPELTARERAALGWTAEGLTAEETGARMGLTASAVNYHSGNAARKLGAVNKHHAAILALRRGLI
jgi:DNA-binding CsgD family transcriptional regulator